MEKKLSKEEATEFFAQFYRGAHHIPGFEPKPFGEGWMIKHDRGDMATYDFDQLTRLVLLAHYKCYRVSVMPNSSNSVKICVWKREREGSLYQRHPTIEQAIEKFSETF